MLARLAVRRRGVGAESVQAKLPPLVGNDGGDGALAVTSNADLGKRARTTTEVEDARQRYLQRKAQRKR